MRQATWIGRSPLDERYLVAARARGIAGEVVDASVCSVSPASRGGEEPGLREDPGIPRDSDRLDAAGADGVGNLWLGQTVKVRGRPAGREGSRGPEHGRFLAGRRRAAPLMCTTEHSGLNRSHHSMTLTG
jgi:hypothetical protein